MTPTEIQLAYVVLGLTAYVAAASFAFVVMYSRVHWERSAAGRHKMRLIAFLGGVCAATVVGNLGMLPTGVLIGLSLALMGALAFEITYLIWLFRRSQRDRMED